MYNSDDHNWKDNDKFRSVVIFSKATAIAMLSPVAVVGNAIILATNNYGLRNFILLYNHIIRLL